MNDKKISIGIVSLLVTGSLFGIVTITTFNAKGTYVSGIIDKDTTWNQAGSPYIVTDDVLLFQEYTITVEPGTEVLLYNDTELTIRGFLNVVGTANEHVIFKAYCSQGKSDYKGIFIENEVGGRAEINYAEFYNAESAVRVGSCWEGGPLNISDSIFKNNQVAVGGYAGWDIIIKRCHFEDNTYAITRADKIIRNSTFINNEYGLYETERIDVYDCVFAENNVALFGGRGDLQGCQIYNNGIGVKSFFEGFLVSYNTITQNNIGLIVRDYDGYVPEIKHNNLYNNTNNSGSNNTGFNLKSETNIDVDASSNWWGTTDESVIALYIWDVYDDINLGRVFYSPYLQSEIDYFTDTDGDGIPDVNDGDDDNDSYLDGNDAFPLDSNEWLDTDDDGTGNNADPDDDGDTYLDKDDAFPLDLNEWLDTDSDGTGNNADTDDDNDGYLDENDDFPLDPVNWKDTDDGTTDDPDDGDDLINNPDTDGDGYLDDNDAFPSNSNEWEDTDKDGIGNNVDIDDDGDGISDEHDAFPLDKTKWEESREDLNTILIVVVVIQTIVIAALLILMFRSKWKIRG